PGPKFTQADWDAFVAAFRAGRATFVYSRLFPVESKGEPGRMHPERDFWFRCEREGGAADELVVLHVHYLGSWAARDERLVAQVNARFTNAAAHYQFEGHGAILAGVMPTSHMFRVTACYSDPKPEGQTKDATRWLRRQAD